MNKKILITASLLGATAIVLGAFGAHALKKVLTEIQLNTFEVGVRYQFYHALFLLFIANINHLSSKTKKIILNLVLLGQLFFSGSIYLLSLQDVLNCNLKFLGPITPIGGCLLIAAWIVLLIAVVKDKSQKEN